jgi:hypothetical protein
LILPHLSEQTSEGTSQKLLTIQITTYLQKYQIEGYSSGYTLTYRVGPSHGSVRSPPAIDSLDRLISLRETGAHPHG